jgi:hypothetical protein
LTGHQTNRAAKIGKLLFAAMLWLMIGLLVSVGALLIAAAGAARHIWLQRAKLSGKPRPGAGEAPGPEIDPVEEVDQEIEP